MRWGRLLPVVGLSFLLTLTLMNGCLWAPELDRVRKEIEIQLPGVTFKKQVALSLGPVTLSLARAVVKLAPETHEAAAYLEDIRDVTIAVYEAENLPEDLHVRLPHHLKKLLARGEWELTVKACEESEAVWILCKTDGDAIKGLYVVVLDRDGLVLVRAHGRLEGLFMKAMREHGRIEVGA